MMTPEALKRAQIGLTSTADKAYALMLSGQTKMAAIRGDETRTKEWQVEQLAPIKAAPEINALLVQGEIAWKAFSDELAPWREPMKVLRFYAKPTQGAGQDEQLRWSNALAEVQIISNDSTSLQELLDTSVHDRDWRMVYACLMGRVHSKMGIPLTPGSSFIGVPLQSLPLPGIEDVEETALLVELAKVCLDYVAVQPRIVEWHTRFGMEEGR